MIPEAFEWRLEGLDTKTSERVQLTHVSLLSQHQEDFLSESWFDEVTHCSEVGPDLQSEGFVFIFRVKKLLL